ncbi:uncharacterized protein LOC106013934, partial [Aplysia californica]|uniref:Uncharacterized protein LOC106013934 n=1 Tax=Aplysia californica TaxID=6500 RepID=A0ABM1AER3_APLCA
MIENLCLHEVLFLFCLTAVCHFQESCEDVEITAEGVALMCLALMVCHRPAGGGVSVDGLGSSPSRDQFSSVIEAAVVCLKCSTAREMEESGRFLSSYASAVLHHCREQDRKWRACDVMEVDPGSADLAQLLPPALVKL